MTRTIVRKPCLSLPGDATGVYGGSGSGIGAGSNWEVPIRFRIVVCASVLVAACALPSFARAASFDVGVSQTQSASVVAKGGLVTFTVDVKNLGTVADEGVFIELGSLVEHGRAADAPYQSFTTSQGTCADQSSEAYGMLYHFIVCELGPLAPGASARITAVAQVNQSANFAAILLPNAHEGGYQDGNNSNNEAGGRVTVSVPPTVVGSKKIKVSGLPTGCATGDFTIHAVAKARKVKKMVASFLTWNGSEGETWKRTVSGKRLTAKIPVSTLANELGRFYKLKIKAKIRGTSRFLTTTVTFQPC